MTDPDDGYTIDVVVEDEVPVSSESSSFRGYGGFTHQDADDDDEDA